MDFSSLTQEQKKEYGQQLLNVLRRDYTDEEISAALERSLGPPWPTEYVNRDLNRVYKPHHQREARFVYSDTPRHSAVLGGEGGGKTVAGIIKTLERLRRGMSGILAGPDLPHLKKSAWPEFQRWCPWEQVVDKHRDRGHFAWEPYAPFTIAFRNGAVLQVGGLDDPKRWRGPNISFAFLDEVAVKRDADAIKVLDGRIRIPGPNGEPPQLFIATTPEMHWLYDYYGPLKCFCRDCGERVEVDIQKGASEICPICGSKNIKADDPREYFKRQSYVVLLPTKDNIENLAEGYAEDRRTSLTAAEARVLLDAAWEDISTGQPFLPTMLWWDECKGYVPPMDDKTPLVVALDAAMGREVGDSDCFGLLVVSRHPERCKDSVAVRHIRTWQVKPGQRLDFLGTKKNPGPERELLHLCGYELDDDNVPHETGNGYNVKCVVFDPTGLHDMSTRFRNRHIVWMREFGQLAERTKADNDLLRLIQEKRILHDGDSVLRKHIQNADRQLDRENKKLRIAKRADPLKIDLAVCLSMASYECLRLNIPC